MKKIALIMDGWKRFVTFAWPAGILRRIRETGEEVNLYIFNSSGCWNLDKDYNMGEYNIFRLPELSDFDGIVLDLNNIRYQRVQEYVTDAARKSGKPVISINNDIEGFYYVGIDNYTSIRQVIAHFHRHHNCRKFWFVMASMENYENKVRVQALRDYMDENRIPYSENDFYFEDFEFSSGCSGFQALYEQHERQMPEVIICANDNIAVGVCETAAKYGYHAPEDFYVSGFDDFDKARYYMPRITTVRHIREDVGYVCAQIFLDLWKGKEVQRFNYTKTTPVFAESCGCVAEEDTDPRIYQKYQVMYGLETSDFEDQVLSLEFELMHCKSLKEMTDWIPKCIPMMNCDAMYLVVDESIHHSRRYPNDEVWHMAEGRQFFTEGYPEEMLVEFAYENGENKTLEGQRISSLFPMFEHAEGGRDFLFMPIHFRNRTVGFFVIRNAIYLMEKQYVFKVLNTLTSAMENLYKKENLEYANKMMSDLYIRDPMTGLYNRLGYQKLAFPMFDRNKKKKENLQIMYLDMDRLKYINDNFGHEYGDFAIKTIAKAILKYVPSTAVPVRSGGDEFLIILETLQPEALKSLIQCIRQEISEKSEKMAFPFALTVSIGCTCTDMNCKKELDDYVREADEIMYKEKTAKRMNRP